MIVLRDLAIVLGHVAKAMGVRRNLLTDVIGVSVGHAEDLALGSGVTVIAFDQPATAAVSALGGAPAGRDTEMLAPHNTVSAVDAVVLSGGSAFGLDAAGGVQAALREQGRGLLVGGVRVPLVPQAIIFDLANGGNKEWGTHSPYRELGYAAANALTQSFELGSFGGGTGATTATVKGGLGSASSTTSAGHTVGAIVVVNPIGTPTIGEGPWFWAAPYEQGSEFGGLGWPTSFDLTPRWKGGPGTGASNTGTTITGTTITGTTIGLVCTDAALTKGQVLRLAIMAHNGLARAVLPVHAPLDGDTIFAASTGQRPMREPTAELTELGFAATLTMARAIARGVYCAAALPVPGAQPSWKDRFATGS